MTRKRGNSADNDAADMTPASDDSLVLPAAAEDLAAVDGSGPVKVRARRASRRRAGSTEPLTEATTKEPGTRSRQRVAVVIPAKDESRRIAATVRAARAIPRVDLVLGDGQDT